MTNKHFDNDLIVSENKGDSILDILGKAAPYFQRLNRLDNMIAITDTEKFLYYVPGKKLNLGNLQGKPIPKGGLIPKALETGKISSGNIPKEVYGINFKSAVMPLKDTNNKIIGSLNIAINSSNQNALRETSEVVQASSEQLFVASQEIASSAQQLSSDIIEVKNFMVNIIDHINETNKILDFVNQISTSSRLLGLNASIESARAGEHGRGFSIIAKEIQKMAITSSEAVKSISKILKDINDISNTLLTKVNETANISQEQVAATEEISASAQELSGCISDINRISKII